MVTIKVRGESFNITNDDVFLDNGHRLQLLSKKHRGGFGAYPRLSKKLTKEMYGRYETKILEHHTYSNRDINTLNFIVDNGEEKC